MSAPSRVVALIQCRTGSSRLPGKVLLPVAGRPMIEHQIRRLQGARTLNAIVVATTENHSDRPLLDLADRLGIQAYAGSEEDVLDRLYQAATRAGATVVVRLTADCPILDPNVVDRFVEHFLAKEGALDYLGGGPSFPEGQDVEVFSLDAMERAWKQATRKYEREHVTPYLWQSGMFRTERLEHSPDLSNMRWTVDAEADLQFIRTVFDELLPVHGDQFGINEVVNLLREKPELAEINAGAIRNEGFLTSLADERKIAVKPRDLSQSETWWARASDLIPAGTQTLSKGPSQYVGGVAPKYLVRACGSHTWDVDGNEYIDYPMGLGAVVLGHCYPATQAAIQEQLGSGMSFSLMHPLEVEVAEMLRSLIPCAEMVRFAKNGSDVTTGAIRLARAHTGREYVAHCGYHGWHDWYIGSTTRNRGVTAAAIREQFGFEYNNPESLARIFRENPGKVAAVIMEPYGATLPEPGFLETVRDLTHQHGAVLIFDEVASGFRFCVGGVHQRFQVNPDLCCFGKAMANGMPLSALVGRREIMRLLEEVFFSFTFGGECLSLAACKATLREFMEKPVVDHLWQMGSRLEAGLQRLISDFGLQQHLQCVGLAPRTFISIQPVGDLTPLMIKSLLQQEILKRGIIALSTAHCISFSHTDADIETTLGAYQEAFRVLSDGLTSNTVPDLLEGTPVQPVFRPTT